MFYYTPLKSLFSREGNVINNLEVVTSFKNKANPVQRFTTREKLYAYDWPCSVAEKRFHVGIVVSFGHLIPEDIIHKFPL